jgi:riboflavin biosynthesis pyrimidine reductase
MSQKTTKKAKSRTTKRTIRKTGTKERKPAFIFIQNDNSVTKVHTEALLDFLKERNVRSVLVDALN